MRKSLWALALVLMAASLAMAGKRNPPTFSDVDLDHNGKITYEELKNAMPELTPERFKELDKNKNDVLDPKEFIILA